MILKFKDIPFPKIYKYASDSEHIPLEFYEFAFPVAKTIDILLGYFSTNSIKFLSESFAEFIFNGGQMRIITNHQLNFKDKFHLFEDTSLQNEDRVVDIFKNVDHLVSELGENGQHFFDCLKFLLKKNLLKIVPVKFNKVNLSHCKEMILYDGDNYISINGSINFTLSALIKNSESFEVNVPWEGNIFKERIEESKLKFEQIISKKHSDYSYLNTKEIEGIISAVGRDKDIQDLLDDSLTLNSHNLYNRKILKIKEQKRMRFKLFQTEVNQTPKFPFTKPFSYQQDAYKAWKMNDKKGLFAMATGTGKTLTALYCLIEEFKITKKQKNIFVVPGKELVRQWNEELKSCNFKNIFLWYSENNHLKYELQLINVLKTSSALNVIITYDSFQSKDFKNILSSELTNFTVVFDEAHNMGAPGFKRSLEKMNLGNRIGLSATPLRLWDENRENEFIENIFNSKPPYTFSFTMEKAISEGFLCKYNYFPFFTYLSNDEFENYVKLTGKIPNGKDGKINSHAAMQRQLLIDQAENKSNVLIKIIDILIKDKNYKYTLVYCAKGTNKSDDRIIYSLGKQLSDNFKKSSLNIQFFLGETDNRDLLLEDFSSGQIDVLLAIKCLDEGVNIPIAQNAIFLASGKNYREFVQRRGRILRKYQSEDYIKEQANIYDIIVIPTIDQFKQHENIAKGLIVNEFKRLFEFYKLAIQNTNTFWNIENELRKYELTQYYIETLINV